ncbi:MAG: hypothetical protein JO073_10195 [Actinobacteria bacterium]|nr:hypothetical protein [Actinomycetota bacterium]
MRRGVALVVAVAALAVTSAHAAGRIAPIYTASVGHRIVAFSLDQDILALAEDPIGSGCPLVIVVNEPSPHGNALTAGNGPTCQFGGHFWVRPGMGARIISNSLDKALWIVENGSSAEAVKGDAKGGETVLKQVQNIGGNGPFFGPVVGQFYLRLFADYGLLPDGTELGGVVSGNNKELWAAQGPVIATGLDHDEHIVSVGADGSIAMWHAHGARYGRVADAHAATAALDGGQVFVLRSDKPQIDVRGLDGTLIRSWPIAPGALPLLDAYVPANLLVYIAGNAVHALRLDSGTDTILARAPAGARMVDVQISQDAIAYLALGGSAGHGQVVVLPPAAA